MGKESTKDDGEAEGDEDTKCKDNRTLVDNNTAQTLSAEDISKMRRFPLLLISFCNSF